MLFVYLLSIPRNLLLCWKKLMRSSLRGKNRTGNWRETLLNGSIRLSGLLPRTRGRVKWEIALILKLRMMMRMELSNRTVRDRHLINQTRIQDPLKAHSLLFHIHYNNSSSKIFGSLIMYSWQKYLQIILVMPCHDEKTIKIGTDIFHVKANSAGEIIKLVSRTFHPVVNLKIKFISSVFSLFFLFLFFWQSILLLFVELIFLWPSSESWWPRYLALACLFDSDKNHILIEILIPNQEGVSLM